MLSQARRQAVRPLVMVRSCLVELRLAKSEAHFISINNRFISEMTNDIHAKTTRAQQKTAYELETMVKCPEWTPSRVLTSQLLPTCRRIRVRRQQFIHLLLRHRRRRRRIAFYEALVLRCSVLLTSAFLPMSMFLTSRTRCHSNECKSKCWCVTTKSGYFYTTSLA